jgi:hypothetical protein
MRCTETRSQSRALLLKYLMNKRHRDRSFADGRGDALDIAAAHIADGKDTRTARL